MYFADFSAKYNTQCLSLADEVHHLKFSKLAVYHGMGHGPLEAIHAIAATAREYQNEAAIWLLSLAVRLSFTVSSVRECQSSMAVRTNIFSASSGYS